MRQDEQFNFLRYRIPPDFYLVDLHSLATLPYKKKSKILNTCECCNKNIKQQRIPLCVSSSQLSSLGEQIPLYFYILKATSIFLFTIVLVKIGGYQFCNFIQQQQCDIINAEIVVPAVGKIFIPVGYEQTNQLLNFIQFCIFAFSLLVLKTVIKIKKYQIKRLTSKTIGKNTLKLINVHKQATIYQIKQLLEPYQVKIVLTYRVKQIEQSLNNMNKLLKIKALKLKDSQSSKKTLAQINYDIKEQKRTLSKIQKQFKNKNNRVSIVFAIFQSSADRKQCYNKYKKSLFSRLFYKCCTCCSNSAINDQSITFKSADQPNDIIWPNIENPYLQTKCRRFMSILICFILLVFGLASSYLFPEFFNQNTIWIQLIQTGIILLMNFFIMILLQFTTQKIQFYDSNTERHLILVKKLTSFLFLNISLSPLIGYYLILNSNKNTNEQTSQQIFNNFAFSVLILALGNIFKPIPIWFSIDRFFRFFNKQIQQNKGKSCMMTQIQANTQFQPIEFPISTFYSLSISSLLMVCFYFNQFQILILIEFMALGFMFFVSKWMLLRVCKSPAGLARKISNLAQSILRIIVMINWIGTNLIDYIQKSQEQKTQITFIQFLFRDIYSVISFGIAIFWLIFLELFVSFISKIFMKRKLKNSSILIKQSDQKLLKDNQFNDIDLQPFSEIQTQSYSNANLHMQLIQQCQKFFKASSIIQ